MDVFDSEWLRHSSLRPAGERRFQLLAVVVLLLFLVYAGATIGGAPAQTLSLVSAIVIFPVPLVVWCAYARAPASLRTLLLLCAWAATLWLAGSLVWYGFFLAAGSTVPKPPGVWD